MSKEKIEQEVGEFAEKLNTALDVITDKAIEHAPQAYEITTTLIQVKSIFTIVSLISLMGVILYFGRAVFKAAKMGFNFEAHDDSANFVCAFGGAIWLIAGSAIFIAAAMVLLSFSLWLGVFSPDLALALKALQATGLDI